MKPSKADSKGLRGAISTGATGLLRGIFRVLAELFSIVREMLRIPAHLWMRVAEWAGALVLRAWQFLWPLLLVLWALLGRVEKWAEREITPLRMTLAVGAVAAIALGASQFSDYHQVTIGTPEYAGVETVAPAPTVDHATAGEAHAWVGLLFAIAALVVIVMCATGRTKAARLLIPIGVLAILVALIIDMPKGLDEGDFAVQYEGAEATLLGGFWTQIVCGSVLIAIAPLIAMYSRPSTAGERARKLPKLSLPRRRNVREGTVSGAGT